MGEIMMRQSVFKDVFPYPVTMSVEFPLRALHRYIAYILGPVQHYLIAVNINKDD